MTARAAFTCREVADLYGVSESKVRHLVRDGVLQRVPHMGASVRIRPDELERVFGPLPKEVAA